MRIRTKLIVTLSAVLALAFVSMSLLNYSMSARRYYTSSVREVLPLLTSNILSEIQQDLMVPIHVSSLMANDTFLKDWSLRGEVDTSEVQRYLEEIKEKYGFFTAFFVSARSDHYYHYNGILKTISTDDAHDVWYYDFIARDVDMALDVDTDEGSNGTLTVFINHRVTGADGTLLGVTGVGLAMSSIQRILSRYQDEYGRIVYMVDGSGLIQAHTDPSLVEAVAISEMEGMAYVASDVLACDGGATTSVFTRQGQRVFLEARYFPMLDWYLIVEEESGAAMNRLRSALIINLIGGLAATCVVVLVVIAVVNHFQGRLERLVVTDELTGVASRRGLLDRLRAETSRAARHGQPLSFLMIDADDFKAINDRYGHSTGDQILAFLAAAVQKMIRNSDVLGRLGGEEFGIILPETDLHDAALLAERIRAQIEAQRMEGKSGGIRVTVSMREGSPDVEDLLHRADAAMYVAKAEGRNCVRVDKPNRQTDQPLSSQGVRLGPWCADLRTPR